MLKVELGGGEKPREGFINVDLLDCADVKLDLDRVGAHEMQLPWQNDVVDEVYSSHCLEHLKYHRGLLWEIVRVCRLGARVELRVPHPFSQMAMCGGHEQVVSEDGVRQWREFPGCWWPDQARWLSEPVVLFSPTRWFGEAKRLHPGWTDEQIMRFVPSTCHETIFVFNVEAR